MIYFSEALAINRDREDPAALVETLNNLGLAYLSQGKINAAQKSYQEAREYAQLLPPGSLLALSLSHLGDVARDRKDYALALDYYHQALLSG